MTDPKALGQRLRDYMRSKGVTNEDLADKTHVSPVTVRNWKSGRKNMTLRHAEAVCRLLAIKVDDLLDPID